MIAMIIVTSAAVRVFLVPDAWTCHQLAGPLLSMGRAFCVAAGGAV